MDKERELGGVVKDECMDDVCGEGWRGRSIDRRIDRSMNRWKNGWMDGQRVCGRMHGQMDKCRFLEMDGWRGFMGMDGQMDHSEARLARPSEGHVPCSSQAQPHLNQPTPRSFHPHPPLASPPTHRPRAPSTPPPPTRLLELTLPLPTQGDVGLNPSGTPSETTPLHVSTESNLCLTPTPARLACGSPRAHLEATSAVEAAAGLPGHTVCPVGCVAGVAVAAFLACGAAADRGTQARARGLAGPGAELIVAVERAGEDWGGRGRGGDEEAGPSVGAQSTRGAGQADRA